MPSSSGEYFARLPPFSFRFWFADWFIRLQEETAKVEEHLLNGNFTDAIISCFNAQKINAFDLNLLEPLLKLLRLSPALAATLAKPEMYNGIAQKLSHKKAVVRLNLLRLVRNILEARQIDYFNNHKDKQLRLLFEGIRVLAEKDSAVLVRNLASDLVMSHIDGSSDQFAIPFSAPPSSSTASSRPRSGRRIYTPPSLQSSVSIPITPTHATRPFQSSAYIEVAASPRRSAVSLAQERDALSYRPRSRDSGSGIPVSSPRRPSTDTQGSGSKSGKSRLPRNSGLYNSRPSLSAAASIYRTESMGSNKENTTNAAEDVTRHSNRSSPPMTAGTSGTPPVPASTKQKRTRAPSDVKQKWSA